MKPDDMKAHILSHIVKHAGRYIDKLRQSEGQSCDHKDHRTKPITSDDWQAVDNGMCIITNLAASAAFDSMMGLMGTLGKAMLRAGITLSSDRQEQLTAQMINVVTLMTILTANAELMSGFGGKRMPADLHYDRIMNCVELLVAQMIKGENRSEAYDHKFTGKPN